MTVLDSQPPAITCPANIVASTDAGKSYATVTFSPTATDNCPGVIVNCSPASGSRFPIGTSTVNCTATDAAGHTATCSFTVTVRDTEPPILVSLTASPNVLSPPNHRMVAVRLTPTFSDNAGTATCQIISVTSNEPLNTTGDGNTCADYTITGPLTLELRAERAQNGRGRIYTITVRCTDSAGNITLGTVTVSVPK